MSGMGLFVLLIIGLFVIGLIALVIWLLVRDKQDTIAPVVEQEAPVVERTVSTPAVVPEIRSGQSQPASLLSIDRDWDNTWNIQVKGRRITSLADVEDVTVRKNTIEAIKTLVSLARAYVQGGASDVSKTPPVAPSKAPDASQFSSLPQGASAASTDRIDLAKEIGDIVDRLLVDDPVLRNHRVQIQNVPGGGIQFVLNGKTYTEIDEIPNEGVKALIHKATQEWNRR